jgi:PhoH-like ATPase
VLRRCGLHHLKNAVWGVTARNREQNFAMNLLMDPEVRLRHPDRHRRHRQDADGAGRRPDPGAGRPPLHRDHRHPRHRAAWARTSASCPAPRKRRWAPGWARWTTTWRCWRKGDGGAGEWGRAATNELIRSRIKIKSMNFMRGRTFLNKYVIIDEAQNLTPKQMKTLITRAGPGTKIICMGNLAQIDTPYLTEGSSGLTYAVDKFKGWPHSGHITLARGERSRWPTSPARCCNEWAPRIRMGRALEARSSLART